MKANEAPEKIYVNFHFIETHPGSHQPLVTKQGINKYDIEYTRTDAFIEKVCDWLSDNLQTIADVDCPSKHHVESIPILGSITQTEFLRKFREEIKYLFD